MYMLFPFTLLTYPVDIKRKEPEANEISLELDRQAGLDGKGQIHGDYFALYCRCQCCRFGNMEHSPAMGTEPLELDGRLHRIPGIHFIGSYNRILIQP